MQFFRYQFDAAAPPETILDRLRREVGSLDSAPFTGGVKVGYVYYRWSPCPQTPPFFGRVGNDSFEIRMLDSWVVLRGRIIPSPGGSRVIVSVPVWYWWIVILFLTLSSALSTHGWIFLALIAPLVSILSMNVTKAKSQLAMEVGLAVAEHRLHLDSPES